MVCFMNFLLIRCRPFPKVTRYPISTIVASQPARQRFKARVTGSDKCPEAYRTCRGPAVYSRWHTLRYSILGGPSIKAAALSTCAWNDGVPSRSRSCSPRLSRAQDHVESSGKRTCGEVVTPIREQWAYHILVTPGSQLVRKTSDGCRCACPDFYLNPLPITAQRKELRSTRSRPACRGCFCPCRNATRTMSVKGTTHM